MQGPVLERRGPIAEPAFGDTVRSVLGGQIAEPVTLAA
jgi:hypothetical protein